MNGLVNRGCLLKLYPNKQAIALCFSNKYDKGSYPPLHFNSTDIQVADSQKQLGLALDFKLSFNEHIESKKLPSVTK